MDETTSATERRAVCGAAADGLWAFHAKGVSHGRPSLKDILWNGSSVQFIDFERFSEARNTARGHAEDLVMLVFNAFAVTGEPRDEIRHMVDTYRGHAPEEIWELAQDWCRKRRWLDWATKPIQMRRPGKAKEFKAIPLTLAAFA